MNGANMNGMIMTGIMVAVMATIAVMDMDTIVTELVSS